MVLPSPRVPGLLYQQRSLKPALQLQKQTKDSTPGCWLLLTPRTWDKCSGASRGTVDWLQSLALSLRTSACPAWFLDHWPASREHIQAGVPCSPVVGSTEHGLEELSWHSALPRTHLSLSPQPRVAFHFIRHELLWAGGHTPSLMD